MNIGHRQAKSLIELLLVISILSIFFSLLITAVQSVRSSAAVLRNTNQLRQINLALLLLAENENGKIRDLAKKNAQNVATPADASIFHRMIPYVYDRGNYSEDMPDEDYFNYMHPIVPIFHNPSDFTWNYGNSSIGKRGKCSFAWNMYAMNGTLDLLTTIRDGSGNTISFADKLCSNDTRDVRDIADYPKSCSDYFMVFSARPGEPYGKRRATFADSGWGDVVPKTDAMSVTRPSVKGLTFQVPKNPESVNPYIPSTPYRSGLTVALFDGSVRTLSPAIGESVFWALVTPSAGDVANID